MKVSQAVCVLFVLYRLDKLFVCCLSFTGEPSSCLCTVCVLQVSQAACVLFVFNRYDKLFVCCLLQGKGILNCGIQWDEEALKTTWTPEPAAHTCCQMAGSSPLYPNNLKLYGI
ncbi:Hypp3384 [Branchiostoma lanceolatum]|uniref:Hypp3384 protein n=1 Tax=Branchiostoma lanceolatum TaxID=7740 RepID=A0A8J9ZZL2_BRALA|nr:Hypp3384 [Branchiostoma lanceolatum]